MSKPAVRRIVIICLVALSVVYFFAVPFLAYMAVAGAMMNNMHSTAPLVLFIGLPGALLAALWCIGLRLTRPQTLPHSH